MTDIPAAGPDSGSSRTRWIIIIVVVLLIVLVADSLPANARRHRRWWVAQAVRGDMPETLSELGTVTPIATVTVLPQLSGYLTEVGLPGRPGRREGPVPGADRPAPI